MELTDKTQRIYDFVKRRKTRFTSEMVGKRFEITTGAASRHLRELYLLKLVDRFRVGNAVFWLIPDTKNKPHERPTPKQEAKPAPVPVAIPPDPPAPQPSRPPADERPKVIWPTSTFKTSYPHVRGYDD